jgi:hypothetical protein
LFCARFIGWPLWFRSWGESTGDGGRRSDDGRDGRPPGKRLDLLGAGYNRIRGCAQPGQAKSSALATPSVAMICQFSTACLPDVLLLVPMVTGRAIGRNARLTFNNVFQQALHGMGCTFEPRIRE